MAHSKLPSWLLETLPEPRMPYELAKLSEERYTITAPAGTVTEFTSPVEAYDSVSSSEHDIIFDKSFHEKKMWFEPGGTGSHRLLISYSDVDRVKMLASDYRRSRRVTKAYRADRSDFLKAFYFLAYHPSFWKSFDKRFEWETEYAVERFTLYPFKRKGKLRFSLEFGSHVPSDGYKTHYFDPRLSVEASSYEAVIVKAAAKVDKFFRADGSEREAVEHKKSRREKQFDHLLQDAADVSVGV